MSDTLSASISALYQSVLGRTADPVGLAAAIAAVDAGIPLAAIAVTLALSPEAQSDIGGLYQEALGRPADPVGLDAAITYLAYGGSMAAIQSILGHSAEAGAAINEIYENVLGRSADAAAYALYQNDLTTGTTLQGVRALVANTQEAQNDISAVYQTVLDRAPTAAELASATAFVAAGGTPIPRPPQTGGDTGSSLANSVLNSVVNSAAAISAINTVVYHDQTFDGASPAGVAAAQSEMLSGFSLTTVASEVAEIQGGQPVYNIDGVTTITPQTIGGGITGIFPWGPAGAYAYTALNGDIVASASPNLVVQVSPQGGLLGGSLGGNVRADIYGFNPATDALLILQSQRYYSFLPNTPAPPVLSSASGAELTSTTQLGAAVYADGLDNTVVYLTGIGSTIDPARRKCEFTHRVEHPVGPARIDECIRGLQCWNNEINRKRTWRSRIRFPRFISRSWAGLPMQRAWRPPSPP